MSYLLVLPALLFRRGGLIIGALGLIAAVAVFLGGVTPLLPATARLLLVLYVLSAPLAGYLAGLLVSEYCVEGIGDNSFPALGALLAFVFVLGSPHALDYFGLAYEGVVQHRAGEGLLSLVALGSGVVLVSIITGLTLIVMAAMVELPCRWIFSVSSLRVHVPFAMLRPLLVVFVLCLAFQILAGRFLEMFNPQSVFAVR